MPITASYSAITRRLTTLGDALSNSVIFTRDPAGTIFVNGGAVAITGGPATVANTDFIDAFGLDLNDVITLDETNGALPAANLSGGNGNDTLTGGSGTDVLNGDAGVDTLFGLKGTDQLFGGNDGDTLTGGDGNDTMDGGAGNDRMIWNQGDDNDVMEGGADSDIAEINASNSAETFLIAQNGTRVAFSRTNPTPFTLDIGTTESLVLNMNGGADVVTTSGSLSGLISLTIDGGGGNDTILAGNGADLLIGGDGNDTIDGNQGNDTAFLGAGNDVFVWDPGDSSDVVEGQADADTLQFNGSNASENITIVPNGGRVLFQRDVAAVLMDLNDVETLTYAALGGLDNVVVSNLTGTDVTLINIALAASGGGGDGLVDSITVNATNGADTFGATSAGAAVDVFGLIADLHITTPETEDRLVLSAGGGDDVIDVSGVAANAMALELQGGLGADISIGSAGNDRFLGGDGNDLALMGAGDDEFVWNPGDDNDTLEGQAGTDTMTFNGSAAIENITVSANGGRILFFRDIAAVTMDLNDVENITFSALSGADNIVINDLSGTDAALVTLNLASTLGGVVGDGAVDAITANGSAVADTVTISGSGGNYTATGLPYTLAVNQSEAGDTLLVLSGAGADAVSAAGLAAGTVGLTINGGAGNDTVTGSAGADLLFGGSEDDTIAGGAGNDQMFGEAGNDTLVWNDGDGTDLMEGGDGSDSAQVNGSDGAEVFTIATNGARVAFNRIDPTPFALDIGTTENLLLNAGGGDDTISTVGNLAALISLLIDAGAGNDTVLAGNGADIVFGGDGNDFVDGNQGNDIAFLGAGNDVFQWDPGDGSDTVEGQANSDTLLFNGSAGNENIAVIPNGGRAILSRDIGAITMDLNDLEQIVVNAGAGLDNIDVNDMSGTEVTNVTVNLAGTIGGTTGDAQFDTVEVFGTEAANIIEVIGTGTAATIFTATATVAVNQIEATDQLIVQGLGGNDTIIATSLSSGVVGLILDGGLGNDDLAGSAGGDTLFGGDGDDTIDGNQGLDTVFLGAGNDTFVWDPGDSSDVVEGQADADTLLFNGSNASENITMSPNGGRAAFFRDVASVVIDMDDVETIIYNALGGFDNVTIGNMAGTDVTRVIVDLAASGGGADGQADTITVNATAIGDIVDVGVDASGFVVLTGLFATVEIRNFDSIDRLIINAGDGNDTIDASGVGIALTINGGVGNDTLTGGNAFDTLDGGPGDDMFFRSPGGDLLLSGGGSDFAFI